ncbi:MAG: DNA cytosine methyltransferase [Clostridiales Family XIII bacterium]|jgi:DNA (cytosine-5)-methyltransferase 1|nr:DNA cytosine methyltransferase [Clostridiales Family XIII bacterium]
MQPINIHQIDLSSAPWAMHEFFAGSGLVAYGLKGMFSPVWANDVSEKKASVYNANFKGGHFVLGDIRNVKGADLPYAHLSWASFPCQDLSLAGSLGGIDAERSGLIWEWLRVLRELPNRPAVLLIENVAGLISSGNGKNYAKLHHSLSELGYKSGAMLLDAIHFVPQSRPRVFIIAIKKDVEIPQDLLDSQPNWLHNKAAANIGASLREWIWWRTDKPEKRQYPLSDIIDFSLPYDKDDVLHLISPLHREKLDGMDDAVASGYRRTRNGKQRLELRFDGVAGCLRTPEGGSSKQFIVVKHKGETHARLLTTREAARLMGAPDSFILPGAYNDGYRAMGDAVVLPVAKFIGESFLLKLMEAAYGGRQDKKQVKNVQRRA